MLVLLYCVVGLGALLTFVIALNFAWKWKNQTQTTQQSRWVNILNAEVLFFVCVDRTLKLTELYLVYHQQSLFTVIVLYIDNVLLTLGLTGTLMLLITLRFVSSFEGSVYEVTVREKRVLYGLITATVSLLFVFLNINDTPQVRTTVIGTIMQVVIAVVILASSMIFIHSVNHGFSSRLTEIVWMSAHCHRPSTKNQSSVDSTTMSSIPNKSRGHNTTVSLPTLDQLRNSSVSDFSSNERSLLFAASKTCVISVWISLCYILYFVAGILIAIQMCAGWMSVIGNTVVGCSHCILGVSLTLSMAHSSHHYDRWCQTFDLYLSKYMAWLSSEMDHP